MWGASLYYEMHNINWFQAQRASHNQKLDSNITMKKSLNLVLKIKPNYKVVSLGA